MDPHVYKELLDLPGNRSCIDCGDTNHPDWGSPKLGILFCLECAGKHRGLGTHVSFVRSVMMDAWTEKEIALMKMGGGNQACRTFLETHGMTDFPQRTIQEKYDTAEAELYRLVLQSRVEGQASEPTTLPKPYVSAASAASQYKKKMQGFGNQSQSYANQSKTAKNPTKIVYMAVVGIGLVGAVGFWMLQQK